MDKLNRLTRNDEWQEGARYRNAKGVEVTFMGWQTGHFAKGVFVGWPVLLKVDGSKEHPSPGGWRGRWDLAQPAQLESRHP